MNGITNIEIEGGVGYQPYIDLAAGVLRQAVMDYYAAEKALARNPGSPYHVRRLLDLERFFHSNWFRVLSMGMEPNWFLQTIKQAGGVCCNRPTIQARRNRMKGGMRVSKYIGNNHELVQRIVRYRAIHRMSQKAFAAHAGLSPALVSHLEANPEWRLRRVTKERLEIAIEEKED